MESVQNSNNYHYDRALEFKILLSNKRIIEKPTCKTNQRIFIIPMKKKLYHINSQHTMIADRDKILKINTKKISQ